jgi:hypothetical protein
LLDLLGWGVAAGEAADDSTGSLSTGHGSLRLTELPEVLASAHGGPVAAHV